MRTLVEQFPAVDIAQLRHGVGGRRRFNAAESCRLAFDDGRSVTITLERRPTNLGYWQKIPRCPTCGQPARVLRLVPFGVGVACVRDLRRRLAAKYRSQLEPRRPLAPAPATPGQPADLPAAGAVTAVPPPS